LKNSRRILAEFYVDISMMLRDYQIEMMDRVGEALARYRSVMVQMPTGTGKTVLLAEVVKHFQRVLVVAHRRELIAQIKARVDVDRVTVESVQRLALGNSGVEAEDFDLIVIDEAHHAVAKTYRQLWERWPKAKFLGLTATPCRLNGATFTDLFDVMLQSWQIQQFIDKGWLSDFDYVSAAPESEALRMVAKLDKRGADGDYQQKQMATVMDVPESIEHLYLSYQAFAQGKKGIVYAIDRQHAQHIADYYQGHGVNCMVIDAKTPAKERQQMVEAYRKGQLDVLVNVDIFSEGFDCPEVEFIQLARPTLSLAKYLQQVGRGMRVSHGKEAVTILDQVGLYQTFGLPTEERDWQQTFSGRLAGKGLRGMSRPVVVKDDLKEQKVLVNLEMVRIRRRSDSLDGLNIYVMDGKYGVMKDGRMTTQPVFERVRRCENGRLFALATYPYALFKNRTTVIDLQGIDQMVQLYGQIELKGDFLYGDDVRGKRVLWDTVGKKYYTGGEPKFERLGGLDVLRDDRDDAGDRYELRYMKGMQKFLFSKGEVLFNSHIAIIRDLLIVKDNGFKSYRIHGYLGDSILVDGQNKHDFMQVTWDGQTGALFRSLPKGFKLRPNYQQMKLRVLK
jgi:superfamily II DNA or RNA helicase